jgi:hypothetical protein
LLAYDKEKLYFKSPSEEKVAQPMRFLSTYGMNTGSAKQQVPVFQFTNTRFSGRPVLSFRFTLGWVLLAVPSGPYALSGLKAEPV